MCCASASGNSTAGGFDACGSDMRRGRKNYRSNGERDHPGFGLCGHEGVVQFDEQMELTTMVLILKGSQIVLVNRVLFGKAGGSDKLQDD